MRTHFLRYLPGIPSNYRNRVTLRFAFRPLKGTRCRTDVKYRASYKKLDERKLVACNNIRHTTATMTDKPTRDKPGQNTARQYPFPSTLSASRTVVRKISHWNNITSVGTTRTALGV
jgi:hypothetical protein